MLVKMTNYSVLTKSTIPGAEREALPSPTPAPCRGRVEPSQLQASLHHPPQQGDMLGSSCRPFPVPSWAGGHMGTPALLFSQYLQA